MKSSVNSDETSQSTGLPALGSWESVYIFVVMVFVIWVVLLAVLSKVYQ